MANTLTTSINWAQAFVQYKPLVAGPNNEPALSSANMTKQVMLSPPFRFPWNRNKKVFQLTQYQQDYTVAISDFGYLELATFQPCAFVTNVAASGGTATYTAANSFKAGALVSVTGVSAGVGSSLNVTNVAITSASTTQFTVALAGTISSTPVTGVVASSGQIKQFPRALNTTPLGESSDQQQPQTLAVQSNDNAGNIGFRVLGVPNGNYNVVVTYQSLAAALTTLTSSWGMPDYVSFIYNRGFLAHMFEAMGDARAAQEKVAFAAALLSHAEGLTDTEINLFLAQYLANPRAMESLNLKTQQGVAARGQ